MKLSGGRGGGGGGGRFSENTPKNVKLNIALTVALVLDFKNPFCLRQANLGLRSNTRLYTTYC